MNVTAGKWHRIWFSYTAKDSEHETVDEGTRLGFEAQAAAYKVEIRNIMVEVAETPSNFQPNIAELQERVNTKMDSETAERRIADLEATQRQLINDMEQMAKDRDAEQKEWLAKMNQLLGNISQAKADAVKDAEGLLEREVSELKQLNDTRVSWEFINNFLTVGNEGIRFGTKDSQSYIMIQKDRLSFYNGGKDAAMVLTDNFISINSGVFNENTKTGHYVEQPLSLTGNNKHINVIRYIP